jgi:hypothetical protein
VDVRFLGFDREGIVMEDIVDNVQLVLVLVKVGFVYLGNKNTPFISYFFPPNKRNIEARAGNHNCSGISSKCYIL